ncbi:unnamed protein product [Protopolystoma xenopodis]|uniref:Uncharacterized protein n=1 Tax=Protopolystoma xenopodis TaxID=117903 RepID=A0A3S5AFH1_9PLAT|nr:unnamed protein product [Protopolystoma xenopodis]
MTPSLTIGSSHSGLQSGSPHCLVDLYLIFLVDRFHSVPVPECISLPALFLKALEARTLPLQGAERLSSDCHACRYQVFPSRILSFIKHMKSRGLSQHEYRIQAKRLQYNEINLSSSGEIKQRIFSSCTFIRNEGPPNHAIGANCGRLSLVACGVSTGFPVHFGHNAEFLGRFAYPSAQIPDCQVAKVVLIHSNRNHSLTTENPRLHRPLFSSRSLFFRLAIDP